MSRLELVCSASPVDRADDAADAADPADLADLADLADPADLATLSRPKDRSQHVRAPLASDKCKAN